MNILVVDDEPELCDCVSDILKGMGHNVVQAHDGPEAIQLVKARGAESPDSFQLVLLDVQMPGMSGLEVLDQLHIFDPQIIQVVITSHGNIKDAVEAMRRGAYNYIEKPINDHTITTILAQADEARQLVTEMSLSSPRLMLSSGQEIIGDSKQMRSLFQIIRRLGPVNTSVLIQGENGTGKELVARAIHFNSARKNKNFVAINCGALPENLVESELFGHEKGAFTGADQRHIGKFQHAEGGTLFLDEIGEIPPAMQVKLLRVLQERKFSPVGSNREIRCDVRIIAATNQDLKARIESGHFRIDLFYRLNVMPIQLSPLRERRDDIPRLVSHFINKFNERHGRKDQGNEISGIETAALDRLKNHNWPGNIRELENVIERAFVMETGSRLSVSALPAEVSEDRPKATVPMANKIPEKENSIDFQDEKERFEREFIVRALKKYEGRINQTVLHAGIPKNTLLRKIRKYEILAEEYR